MIALSFVRQWGGGDRVVWVDIARVNESWRRERGFYIPRKSPNRTREWVMRLKFRRIPMPHISLYDSGDVSFTDGRHRFAWFRDQGIKAIPVTVESRRDAEAVRKRFGSRRRRVEMRNEVFQKLGHLPAT